MDRLASPFLLAALLSLPVAACGDDSTTGSGTESETETGTAGSSTSEPTATSTTTTTTTNGTMGGTSGSTGPGATDSTGLDSSGGPSTDSGTTTGVDECEVCVADNCGDEVATCLGDPDCECWLDCVAEGNEFPTCGMMCNGMPPGELFDVFDCVDNNCDAECNGGGSSGGGMGGQTYDPCMGDMDCDMGTTCNMFLGYCSIDCMGDDNNCPDPATGNITPTCSGMSDNCLLPCGNGDTCPDGMSCQMVGGGGFQLCLPN